MENIKHKDMAAGRWHELTLAEQLGNVGSEVGRALNWQRRGHVEYAERARERALELIDLTAADKRWHFPRKREILRMREVLCDFWWGDNEYGSTSANLEKYFMAFAYYARASR